MALTQTLQIPLTILAQTQAVWYPHRKADRGAIFELRRDFHKRGVTIRPGDASEAGRKAFSRVVTQLAKQGILRRFRDDDGRTTAVRLTIAGEVLTYSLIGLPDAFGGSIAWLTELLAAETHPGAGAGAYAGWVPEWILAKTSAWGPAADARAMYTEALLAALPAQHGWAEANHTAHGQMFYKLTRAGRQLASGEEKLDLPDVDKPKPSAEASVFFDEAFAAAMQTVRAAAPTDRSELGSVPLPASMTNNAYYAAQAEANA